MLLDTSGLLCLHYQTEPLHAQARAAYQQATTRLTHSYICCDGQLNNCCCIKHQN